LSPPQFCSSCGASFGGHQAVASQETQNSVKPKPFVRKRPLRSPRDLSTEEETDQDDGLDINEIPKINNFQCETSGNAFGGRIFKLDSFLPQEEESKVEETNKTKRKKSRPRKSK
jgi:hypothetical protein